MLCRPDGVVYWIVACPRPKGPGYWRAMPLQTLSKPLLPVPSHLCDEIPVFSCYVPPKR